METDGTTEDFLARVQQLDEQRQREDKDRRQRRAHESFTINSSSTTTFSSSKSSIPHSESIKNFNASVSKEYRLNMDELVYESAYNYDKSRNKENQRPTTTSNSRRSDNAGDDEPQEYNKDFSSSRSGNYKKYDNLDIIRFDDYVTKSKKNHIRSDQPSKYSKFELDDEQKQKLDDTLSSLIGTPVLQKQPKGGDWSVAAKSKPSPQPPSNQIKRSPRKLDLESPSKTRESTPTPASPIKKSPVKVHINRFIDDEEEEDRPKLPTRPNFRDEPEVKPLLPVRPELRGIPLGKSKPEVRPKSALISSSFASITPPSSQDNTTSPEKSSSRPPVRPKSTWLESTMKNSSSTPQGTAARHIPISSGKSSWLNSATRGSTSTNQGLKTTTNFTIDKKGDTKTWLSSAKTHSTSTAQGLDTTSKIHVTSQESPASWLESAKKVSNVKPFEQPRLKIAPIVPSKSNTLSQIMEQNELSKSQQEKTLKELTNAKLNHIDSLPSPPKTQHKDAMNFEPITLKKTRGPPVPSHTQSGLKEPSSELTGVKLKPALPARKPSLEVPEALKRSHTLKPASPTRKASMEVPEALKKSQTLKPAVPLRKPSMEVPEALTKAGALKGAKPLPEKERIVPEGLKKSKELKPAPPKRKVSTKELEALSALNKLKKSDAPETKVKPRVVSESKQVLNKKLQQLKHVKEDKSEPEQALDKRAMLERVLQRAQTAPSPMLMAKEEDIVPTPKLQRASTFDTAKDSGSDEMLTHPNKTRSKGPKRRTPKSVK